MLTKSTAQAGAQGDKPGECPRLALDDGLPTDDDKKRAQENKAEILQKLIEVRERQFMTLAEKDPDAFHERQREARLKFANKERSSSATTRVTFDERKSVRPFQPDESPDETQAKVETDDFFIRRLQTE